MESTETKLTRKRTKKVKAIGDVPNQSRLRPFVYRCFNAGVLDNCKGPSCYLGMDPGYDDGPFVAQLTPVLEDEFNLVVHNLGTGLDPAIKSKIGHFTFIANRLSSLLYSYKVASFFLEDYAASRSHKAHSMGELGMELRHAVAEYINRAQHTQDVSRIGIVGIGQWKKLLGLKGNASKIEVQFFLLKRYGLEIKNDNIADAIALSVAAYGNSVGELPPIGAKFNVTYI